MLIHEWLLLFLVILMLQVYCDIEFMDIQKKPKISSKSSQIEVKTHWIKTMDWSESTIGIHTLKWKIRELPFPIMSNQENYFFKLEAVTGLNLTFSFGVYYTRVMRYKAKINYRIASIIYLYLIWPTTLV